MASKTEVTVHSRACLFCVLEASHVLGTGSSWVCGSPVGTRRPWIPSFTHLAPSSRCQPCILTLQGWIMGPCREGPIAAMTEVLVSMCCPQAGNRPQLPASGLGPPVEVGVLSSPHSRPSALTVQVIDPACSAICLMSLGDTTFGDTSSLSYSPVCSFRHQDPR